jgi:hypothetical protein
MTEQRRKKNINYIFRVRREDSKKCSGTGLVIDCHRPWSMLYSSTRLGDSSTMFHSARGLVDHISFCSGTHQPYSMLCSGTVLTTLRPQLDVCFPRLHVKFDSYIVGRSLLFTPCYKAHASPSSKLGDYIDTMHLSVHLRIKFPWSFILDPGTTCLRHLLPGLGTKWAHFI